MKKVKFIQKQCIGKLPTFEGETIETKCARITQTNEPITDGAPVVYTEKKDGVRPEYDIRTDRWDIAIDAMDAVNASKIAKSKEYMKKEDTPSNEPTES